MKKPINIRQLSLGFMTGLLATFVLQAQGKSQPPSGATELLKTVPLEQLISQTRKRHGAIIIQSTQLSRRDDIQVRVINFIDSDKDWFRQIFNANTGKEIEIVSLKNPMPMENILDKVRQKA